MKAVHNIENNTNILLVNAGVTPTLVLVTPGLGGGEETLPPWDSTLSHSGPNFKAVSDILIHRAVWGGGDCRLSHNCWENNVPN